MAGKAILSAVALLVFFAVPAAAQSVSHGQTLYKTCRQCHTIPPGLPGTGAAGAIQNAIDGVGSMNFLKGVYSSADLNDLVAYIASLNGVPPPPPPFTPPTPPPPAVPQFNYSDLWWDPNESGWGLNIVQHGNGAIFGVMFTYDSGNVPAWYVIPGGSWSTATNFTGTVYRVSGTAADQPFVRSAATNAGSVSLEFTDKDHASLAMIVNGVQAVKQIQRQAF
jgi:hypothetical protein